MSEDHIRIRRHVISQVESYEVFEQDLDAIEREGSDVGLDFQVALFCITFASSFFASLLTMTTDSIRTYTTFVTLVAVGAILGIAFGIKWFRSRGSFKAILRQIRERQIGPVGDEDHPLRPSEVAQLPVVVPPVQPAPEQALPPAATGGPPAPQQGQMP